MPAAAYAIVGALVGATASLFGVYITTQQQVALDELETKRDAYAAFVTSAYMYTNQLRRIQDICCESDELWTQETGRGLVVQGELFGAMSVVTMVGSVHVATSAIEVQDALTSWSHAELGTEAQLRSSIDEAIGSGHGLLVDFMRDARADLGTD